MKKWTEACGNVLNWIRSCVEESEKRERKKEKLIDHLCSFFYSVVTEYCTILASIQHYINTDSGNLST